MKKYKLYQVWRIVRNNKNKISQMQNNNSIYTIQDIYTSAPIEQSTDALTNQTSFVLNFYNAYHLSQHCEVQSIAELKCKYCKGFYFPLQKQTNLVQSSLQRNSKHKLGNKVSQTESKDDNKLICGLCGAVNDIKHQQTLKKLPQFEQSLLKTKEKQNEIDGIMRFDSSFQSVIFNQIQKDSVGKEKINGKDDKVDHKQNSISFLFYLDLTSLKQVIKQPIITYLKTVIREYFLGFIPEAETNPQIQDSNHSSTQRKSSSITSQSYRLVIALNINDQLYLSDINTCSTINIDSIIKEKILSNISIENSPEMYERQNKRKQSLIKLINHCSVDLNVTESLDRIDNYLDLVLEVVQDQESGKRKHGVNGTMHYNMLLELLAVDKGISRSYLTIYVGGSPLLNYQPHQVNKSNLYSICYVFYQPSQQNHHPNQTSQNRLQSVAHFKHISSTKFQQSNLRNQILLIRDNNQVHFISDEEQGLQEFYYRLYELLSIVEMPKLFRPRWSIKTDNKYPPILSNNFPSFFINPKSLLLFVVSCLINTSSNHKKFQISVAYEDFQRRQKLWTINFTKDHLKQSHQLNQLYKINRLQLDPSPQSQQISLLQKLPQIYNSLLILCKFAMNMCIRGKNNLPAGKSTQPNKSLFTLNTITSHQICIFFQSIIHQGVFKMGSVQIGTQYVESMYDYCNGVKNISFEILKLLSSCELNPKKTAQMIYPLLIRNYQEQNSSCIVYWGDGYYCLNDYSEDQTSEDEEWYANFIDAHHQRSAKYYTKRYNIQNHIHTDDHLLIKFYLKKLDLHQNLHSYLPVYFIPKNQ